MNDLNCNLPEKQTRIFNAAVQLFSQNGYNATTTKDIAQFAGVAEGTVFHYYKTKKHILEAITHAFIENMGEEVFRPVEVIFENAAGKDVKRLLRELMMDRMEMVSKLYPLASTVLTEILFQEDMRNIVYERFLRRALEAFEKFHSAMVADGILRGDVPAEAMFRSTFANILFFVAQHKLFGPELTRAELEKEFEAVADVILNGIAAAHE